MGSDIVHRVIDLPSEALALFKEKNPLVTPFYDLGLIKEQSQLLHWSNCVSTPIPMY